MFSYSRTLQDGRSEQCDYVGINLLYLFMERGHNFTAKSPKRMNPYLNQDCFCNNIRKYFSLREIEVNAIF